MAVDKPAAPKIDVDGFLSRSLSSAPAELKPFFESFENLYRRKLWHQLTVKIFEFLENPASTPYRVEVFNGFVRDFESRLSPLRLVELAVRIAPEISNPERHTAFLTELLDRVDAKASPEARVLLLAELARAKLLYGDAEGTRRDIDAARAVLDGELGGGGPPSVNAAYYGVSADYFKAKAEYAAYYRNSLLYLACVDVEKDMAESDRQGRAHDLALSAFLGDTIYNFGELLMHPILDSLRTGPHGWLNDLLNAFNEGSIGKFEALAPLFSREPILQENYPFLRQKICLMALIESVFKREAYDRTMSFQTISAETHLPLNEVEHLLMKALSLKLIKGTLDQVDGKAQITWVQPRVLSPEQIGGLAKRLEAWSNRLNTVEQRITPEVLANA